MCISDALVSNSPFRADDAVASPETQWLEQVGLEALLEKAHQGAHITEADLKEQTAGFTPMQVNAVRQRVNTLNA